MKINPEIFKAYDIRGLYPEDIDEEVAYRIGLAYTQRFKPKQVAVGHDVRAGNIKMKEELVRGLLESGLEIVDIGGIATDMLYFTVGKYGYDGGIVVSASHNPAGWGGMKIVKQKAEPIFQDNGLLEIRDLVMSDGLISPNLQGKLITKEIEDDYFNFLLSFVDFDKLKPQKIVANPNFGFTGQILKRFITKENLPLEIIPLNFEPDGTFPKGRPDPFVPENRDEILALTQQEKADFGVAWDADGDRVSFCDNQGNFYEPCYITTILIENLLKKNPGAKIIYDVRYASIIEEAIKKNKGQGLINKVGHSLIKARMKEEDAVFCGESSGHYYFKENWYCDNGLIPFMLLWEELSSSQKSLSELLEFYTSNFFVSGEFNVELKDEKFKEAKIKELAEKYNNGKIDYLDGISVEYDDWRFNVRPSNTEPLLRCNIEGKSKELVEEKKKELAEIINR